MVRQHSLQLFSDELSVLRLVFNDALLCQQTCYKQSETETQKHMCKSVSLIPSLPVNLSTHRQGHFYRSFACYDVCLHRL